MPLLGYLIVCCSELIGLHYLSSAYLVKKDVSRWKFLVLHLIYVAVAVLQPCFVYDPNLNTAINLLMRIVITQCYRGGLYTRVLICAASLSAGFLSEGILFTLLRLLLDIDLAAVLSSQFNMLLTCAASGALAILLLFAIVKLIRFYRTVQRKLHMGIFFMVFTLMLLAVDLLVNFGDSEYLVYSLLVIACLVISAAILLDLFREQLKSQRDSLKTGFLEEQLTLQLSHYESLYAQMHQVYEIRHDVRNILLNIESYLKLGEMEKALAYVRRYRSEVSAEDAIDSGAPLIDAVLTAKRAAFHGDFQLRMDPLHCEHMDLADLGMMLAIALDNAAEGTEGVQNPYLSCAIVQQARMIVIQVKNPTLHRPDPAQRFPASTKTDAAAHGYGLKSCSRLAEKWNGQISWSCQNGVFQLDILIQDIPPLQA